MSKDNVKKFFGEVEKDAGLKKQYSSLIQAHLKETELKLAEKLVEFGKNKGFTFSKDDLIAARAEIIDRANSNDELVDGALANVAGGGRAKTVAVCASIFSIGIICALSSLINAAHDPNIKTACAASLTMKDDDCKNY